MRKATLICYDFAVGGVAEWTMAAVLKTVNPHGFMGSNPIPSAIY